MTPSLYDPIRCLVGTVTSNANAQEALIIDQRILSMIKGDINSIPKDEIVTIKYVSTDAK